MVTITFEIYDASVNFVLFVEVQVEKDAAADTFANLSAMPNVRNLSM